MTSGKSGRFSIGLCCLGAAFLLAVISTGCGASPEPPPVVKPAAPSGLTATAAAGRQINLSWTVNSNNETGFKIERKTGSSGTWTALTTVGAGVSTYQDKDPNLVALTTYHYQVKAYNSAGDSSFCDEASAQTLAGAVFEPGTDTITLNPTLTVQGGTLTGPAGSPIEGVVVTFPPGALPRDSQISLGYNSGTVTPGSGTWGNKVILLSSSAVSKFELPVTIRVPFNQSGDILVPYYIDANKKFHLMTITQIDRSAHTVTFETYHASYFTRIKETLGFSAPAVYASGFTPGRNGFHAPSRGLDYGREGECFGMATFALWHYRTQPSSSSFYDRFLSTVGQDFEGAPLTGQSIIATRAFLETALHWTAYLPAVRAQQDLTQEEEFTLLKSALLNTDYPVPVYLFHKQTTGAQTHAVLAYAYENNNFSVYDPNLPNSPQTMTFDTTGKSWNAYGGYDGIMHCGDGSLNPDGSYPQILAEAENGFITPNGASISILSHNAGESVASRNVKLSGIITSGQTTVTQLEVFVGSTSFKTDILPDGAFDLDICLRTGVNHLQFITRGLGQNNSLVIVPNNMETVDFTLYGNFIASILEATLTWDTNDTDLDLYLIDPTGDYSSYFHTTTASGGELDKDVISGYGPEHWILESNDTIQSGQEYLFRVHYYSDHGQGPTNYTMTIHLYEGTAQEATYSYRGNLAVSNFSNDQPANTGDDWRDIATIQLASGGGLVSGTAYIKYLGLNSPFRINVPVPPQSERLRLKLQKRTANGTTQLIS